MVQVHSVVVENQYSDITLDNQAMRKQIMLYDFESLIIQTGYISVTVYIGYNHAFIDK